MPVAAGIAKCALTQAEATVTTHSPWPKVGADKSFPGQPAAVSGPCPPGPSPRGSASCGSYPRLPVSCHYCDLTAQRLAPCRLPEVDLVSQRHGEDGQTPRRRETPTTCPSAPCGLRRSNTTRAHE